MDGSACVRYFASGADIEQAPSATTPEIKIARNMAKNRAAHYGVGKLWSFEWAKSPTCIATYERDERNEVHRRFPGREGAYKRDEVTG